MTIEIEIMLRFIIAVIWGAIIGAEREYRGKAAGFRTTILISIGACFFTVMSVMIGGEANPDRIASNIVTGLGFLCAGVIFRADNHINGITTAATIWSVAAISMGIGAGHYQIAAFGGTLILIVLTTLTYLQEKIDRINQHRIIHVTFDKSEDGHTRCKDLFSAYAVKSRLIVQQKAGNQITLSWEIHANERKMESLNLAFLMDEFFFNVEILNA
ncbi:MgtC/SapB family protein [Flavobacterium cerinum]|uniref:MgtC/SapB family protein n=1 Tax=Flavobacterium cerinum TaxID=2502784 RepID=A0ABY5ISB9_9FLAO|nr:MgtC/SapB family protein [Flavobacterium cerinum]UUC45170.1 MgtC/SapB family protein [Flavobacterium cerinum]